MSAMTEPSESQPNTRRGCFIFWLPVAIVVAGIVTVVTLWPDNLVERQDAAVDACKGAVNEKVPTAWRKLRQESSFQVDGDKAMTVTGEFSTKDSGSRQFTCTVDDGKVTAVDVRS